MLDLEQLKIKLLFENWEADETSVSGRFQKAGTNLFGLNISADLMDKVASKKMLLEHFDIELHYPPKYDLRDVNKINYTTSIKDQGNCGACVAFSLCAVWEIQLKLHDYRRFRNIDLSEAYLFFCSSRDCRRGWDFESALRFALAVGTCDESCFPYTGSQQECIPCTDQPYRMRRIRDWNAIDDDDIKKHTISKHGPLLAGMKVYEDFKYYSNGIYEYIAGDFLGNHAVSIIGYNDTEEYWICKNSWGTGWGESGWFKIKYGECNIDINPMFKIDIR